jgi:hypothetical protein
VVTETVDVLAETIGDSEIIISAVSAITTDPDLLSLDTSNKALEIISQSSKRGPLKHESAKEGMTSLSNLVTVFKLNEMNAGESFGLKKSYLATMDAARSVLDAVTSCEKPFHADSDIISAAKHSFEGGQVNATDGSGISFERMGGDKATPVCANIASFSVNTYSWDTTVKNSMASGTTSINLSAKGGKDAVQPDRSLLISIYIDSSSDGISDLDLDCRF